MKCTIPQLSTISKSVNNILPPAFDDWTIENAMVKQVIEACMSDDEEKLGRMVNLLGESAVEKIIDEFLESLEGK